jgi:hypothetical protein
MPGGSGEIEVLSQGPPDDPRRPRRERSPRRRPRPVVVAALVVVLGGAAWIGYAATQPGIPALRLSPLADQPDGATASPTPWQPGENGRPSGGVQLTVGALVSPGRAGETVTLLGLSGPGILVADRPPIVLSAGRSTSAALVTDLDCAAVPLPVRAADYRIRTRVVAGSRTSTGSVPLGGLAATWASSVEQACGSWLARHDLTVVQASASVDATSPVTDLVLLIANTGSRPAYLALGQSFGALTVSSRSPRETVLPPRQTSTLHLHVDIGGCDAVPSTLPSDVTSALSTTEDFGVVALVGSRPATADPAGFPGFDGQGPTGILIAPGPRTSIAQAMRSACADLNQFVTLIADGGLTVDPRSGIMTVRIVIDGSPGRVADVQLVSDPATADPTAFTPLWSTSRLLVPDANGQVTTTLRYRVPVTSACPSQGAYLPGFTLIARVPYQGHVKTLRYEQGIDPSQDPKAIGELCPFGTPFP